MLSNEEMNDLLAGFDARMSGINSHYISLMAEHIRDIGQLTASDVDRLEAMRRISRDMDVVKREIAAAASLSDKELEQIFTRTVESGIDFLNTVFGRGTISLENNYGLQNLLKAQILQTKADLKNFSNTTVVSKYYRQGVDRAIQAVRSGMEDYKTAIRSVVRQNASEGLRVLTDEQGMHRREGQNSPLVRYESGITRRLDTAARQNILDGVRQLNQQCMNLVGQQLGADGVEISAHILCAEDHIDYQGEQFTNEEFDRLQNELQRPFGQWNCRHMWWPVFIGVSKPSNDPETLEAYRQYSREQITLIAADGREITRSRYEWTQEMRRLETATRYEKDVKIAADVLGDKDLSRQCNTRIQRYKVAYNTIAESTGIEKSTHGMIVSRFNIRSVVDPHEKAKLRSIYSNMVTNDAEALAAFKRKFDSISTNRRLNKSLYESAIEMLTHRSGTDLEDMYLLDAKTGEILHKLTTSTSTNGTNYTETTYRLIDKARREHREIISIHNHPNGLPPTLDDGSSARSHNYRFGVAVGHNLEVYVYGKADEVYSREDLEVLHATLCDEIGSENIEFNEKIWYNYLREFGMAARRVKK